MESPLSDRYNSDPLPRRDESGYDICDKEYPGITKHLGEFQVKLKRRMKASDVILPGPKTSPQPSITVFKRKNLKNFKGKDQARNIYEHNLVDCPVELNAMGMAVVSCMRCRKLKKKCTRSVPECSNCVSSEELCVYVPRKSKTRDATTTRSNHSGSLPGVKKSQFELYQRGKSGKRLSLPLINSASTKNDYDLVHESTTERNPPSPLPESDKNYLYDTKRHSAHDFAIILN